MRPLHPSDASGARSGQCAEVFRKNFAPRSYSLGEYRNGHQMAAGSSIMGAASFAGIGGPAWQPDFSSQPLKFALTNSRTGDKVPVPLQRARTVLPNSDERNLPFRVAVVHGQGIVFAKLTLDIAEFSPGAFRCDLVASSWFRSCAAVCSSPSGPTTPSRRRLPISRSPSAPTIAKSDKAEPFTKVPATVQELRDLQSRVQAVYKKVMPAVVGIQIGGASGSGVIVSEDGYVLTAGHVSGKPGQECTVDPARRQAAQGQDARPQQGHRQRHDQDHRRGQVPASSRWASPSRRSSTASGASPSATPAATSPDRTPGGAAGPHPRAPTTA